MIIDKDHFIKSIFFSSKLTWILNLVFLKFISENREKKWINTNKISIINY